MTWDTIDLDIDDDSDVATITVDRPEQLNALTVDTLEAIEEALADAEAAGARALVFAGAGRRGVRRGRRHLLLHGRTVDAGSAGVRRTRSPRRGRDRVVPAPTVAAIDGYAFGGGSELALACDLRVAAESAVIGQTEIDLGIIPGWGGTQRLSRLVGDETAKRLVFLGERIDASEAADIGLVGEVVADDAFDDRIDELSRELAAKPAFAMRAAKEALNAPPATGRRPAGSPWSAGRGPDCVRHPRPARGDGGVLEKREPDFE